MAANAAALVPAFVCAAVEGLPFSGFRGRTVDAARGRAGRARGSATVVEVFKRLGMSHVGAMISQTMNYGDTHAQSDDLKRKHGIDYDSHASDRFSCRFLRDGHEVGGRAKPWRWWIRFRRCTAHAGDHGNDRTLCSGIAATTRRRFGVGCGRGILCRGSLCVVPRTGGLGRWRWVVERTFAWLNQFRRLRVRYDKRADIHEAFLSLGCALICWQSLRKTWRTA